MSTVRFISDLHFDHKKIVEYSGGLRRGVSGMAEHNEWLVDQWNCEVKKNDLTWILGDVSFSRDGLKWLNEMNGVKHLILGNHDTFPITEYQKYFHKIHGFLKYKGFILSHAPIREESLRGRVNIHGHTHKEKRMDYPYVNVSVEACNGVPVSYFSILEELGEWDLNQELARGE